MNSSPAMIAANREVLIDGRPLRVFDGHRPDVGDYVRGLSRAACTRIEFARPTVDSKCWTTEVETLAICEITSSEAFGVAAWGSGYKSSREHTNVASYGDDYAPHYAFAIKPERIAR